MFLWWPCTKIVQAVMICQKNMAAWGWGLFSLYIYIENFKNVLIINQWTAFNMAGMFLWWASTKIVQAKNMAARGRGLFSLYIYIENFRNLLSETTGQSSMLLGRNVAFVTFYQDCSSPHDTSKNLAPKGHGLLSLYICIENFKTLLVRNHLTDFNITWQECSFDDPLPRLFQHYWFVKKHGR